MDTESQPIVWLPNNTKYGLYYWIFLNDHCDVHMIRTACSQIQHTVREVKDPYLIAGVGFSFNIWKALCQNPGNMIQEFEYQSRSFTNAEGVQIELPATGGDIFIHAKANNVGSLYEFLRKFKTTMPLNSIDEYRTIVVQGFTYTKHNIDNSNRDLSGFIDGMVNANDPEKRHALTVTDLGGSYAITQRWEHVLPLIRNPTEDDVSKMEKWIGRERNSGEKLKNPVERAHIKRTNANNIVRQSLPFTEKTGTDDEQSGLFFLAYAKDTAAFDILLDEMVRGDGDMLFGISTNVSGAYWYFPPMTELAQND